jgi:two-component system sensor histidine kinase MprB
MHIIEQEISHPSRPSAVPAALDDLSAQELRHDLRQPLTAVSLLVDAVVTITGIPPEVAGVLKQVQQQTDWMVELLRSTEVEQPEVAVVDLAEAVEGPCSATPEDAPYEVRFDKRDEAYVLVDPVALKRSVWNLMDNARRAVADGGTVEVRVRRQPRDVVLEVADSGPGFGGLAPHHGHGLVGVRRFAERFGGDFSAGSSSLGGALVTLKLPLAFGGAVDCGR